MKEIKIYTEYVTLGQFLKIADIIQTGGEAKFFLSENVVYVNDEEDNRRGRKLTRQYVFLAIKTAAQQAEIKKNIHPHILRHSFASALVKGGANLIVVKEMMGHASVVSTEIYTHLDTTHLRETLMLYHPHYQNLNKKKSEESQ